jgi:hypothetical protein
MVLMLISYYLLYGLYLYVNILHSHCLLYLLIYYFINFVLFQNPLHSMITNINSNIIIMMVLSFLVITSEVTIVNLHLLKTINALIKIIVHLQMLLLHM